jgi:flavin reductase (DIM6/NTAB) family NADH-FMN oxidoreductase RutF
MNREDVFGLLPCSVVFVSTAHEDKRDIMTATAMFVSEKESLVILSVARDHLTYRLLSESGRFTVAVASEKQKELAIQVGSLRGDVVDKCERLPLSWIPTVEGSPSAPEGCAAWMACRVETTQELPGYCVVLGRVTAHMDFGTAPLVWHKGDYASVQPL